MRYCTKCKKLIKTSDSVSCPTCKRKTIDDPSHYSPVYIVTANGFELERIRAALHDADIPYTYNESRRDAGIRILNSAPPENCDVYVPLSAYQDAWDTLVGIGALSGAEEQNEDDPLLQKAKKEAKEEKELDPAKAKRIRVISLLAFLLILVIVAWLTDFVLELIKGTFV